MTTFIYTRYVKKKISPIYAIGYDDMKQAASLLRSFTHSFITKYLPHQGWR